MKRNYLMEIAELFVSCVTVAKPVIEKESKKLEASWTSAIPLKSDIKKQMNEAHSDIGKLIL